MLEIGSGSRPHPRTTVLTDLLSTDSSQREGRALVLDGRPFVIADGEALPFCTGAFDYCICSHVLEHADDAARMIAEMQRVARAGYIETPTELRDWLCSVPPYTEIHKWFVNRVGDELILTRKTPANSHHRFGAMLNFLRHDDPWFERWIEKSPHLFVVQHEWQGSIRYRIEEESPLERLGDSVLLRPLPPLPSRTAISSGAPATVGLQALALRRVCSPRLAQARKARDPLPARKEMTAAVEVSVIIVNYETSAMVRRCVESLQAQSASHEIIVVDNPSDSRDVANLADLPVALVQNSENVGYGLGVNAGAAMSNGRVICVLNPDTVLPPGTLDQWLQMFHREAGHRRLGCLCPPACQ